MCCRTQTEEAAAWEAEKEADSQRLKRHQRVLDKQSRALLKLPNRKERSEVTCLLQLQLKSHAVSADCITETYMSPKRKLPVQLCRRAGCLPLVCSHTSSTKPTCTRQHLS